ncbi:hypothetical protein TNCV_5060641 [Trichonephila clavipes]|nr:hypothetical protein TNCV_5060641 [Trichonephila clavipes]
MFTSVSIEASKRTYVVYSRPISPCGAALDVLVWPSIRYMTVTSLIRVLGNGNNQCYSSHISRRVTESVLRGLGDVNKKTQY